jgi:hypothetical protein
LITCMVPERVQECFQHCFKFEQYIELLADFIKVNSGKTLLLAVEPMPIASESNTLRSLKSLRTNTMIQIGQHDDTHRPTRWYRLDNTVLFTRPRHNKMIQIRPRSTTRWLQRVYLSKHWKKPVDIVTTTDTGCIRHCVTMAKTAKK